MYQYVFKWLPGVFCCGVITNSPSIGLRGQHNVCGYILLFSFVAMFPGHRKLCWVWIVVVKWLVLAEFEFNTVVSNDKVHYHLLKVEVSIT